MPNDVNPNGILRVSTFIAIHGCLFGFDLKQHIDWIFWQLK